MDKNQNKTTRIIARKQIDHELNIINLKRLIEGDSRLNESEDGSSLHQGMNIIVSQASFLS